MIVSFSQGTGPVELHIEVRHFYSGRYFALCSSLSSIFHMTWLGLDIRADILVFSFPNMANQRHAVLRGAVGIFRILWGGISLQTTRL